MQSFRKVVVPVAGWGTRSLPASKNVPKEMLPIYNRPVIQYVMEEALRAGVTSAIFVTNRDKSVIEDYFDYNLQLEAVLQRGGKQDKLAEIHQVAEMVNIMSVRQKSNAAWGMPFCVPGTSSPMNRLPSCWGMISCLAVSPASIS